MLFRIWQHALMDQPMPVPELWHWVHVCYGEELGLSTDDEDYASSISVGRKHPSRLTPDLLFEESTQTPKKREEVKGMPVPGETAVAEIGAGAGASGNVPVDLSDTSETDDDKNAAAAEGKIRQEPVVCPTNHEGKLLLQEVLPGTVNEVFTLLFTYNDFNKSVMESLKYSDIHSTNWEESGDSQKTRVITLTVPVGGPVGPKTCRVTETQVMQSCSRPGELYVIDVEAVNAGVPYCDSFYITTHYCLTWTSDNETTFTVHCQIKYRKSVWGFVKGFIEKHAWAGLEEFYTTLRGELLKHSMRKEPQAEVEEAKMQKVERVEHSPPVRQPQLQVVSNTSPAPPLFSLSNDLTLWAILGVLVALLLLNAVLYYKLSVLEDYDQQSRLSSVIDSQILSRERSHDQWVSLLRSQAVQHYKEIQQWRNTLKSIVSLLKEAEDSITNLHSSIQSAVNERVVEALKPFSSLDDIVLSNKRNEL